MLMGGAVVVQILKPRMTKTFDKFAQQVFIPYLEIQLRNVSRLDLAWDMYISDSLKGSARTKRGKGIHRRVVGSPTLPGNWQNFLKFDENKDKDVSATFGQNVLCTSTRINVTSLEPCIHGEAIHEEADES